MSQLNSVLLEGLLSNYYEEDKTRICFTVKNAHEGHLVYVRCYAADEQAAFIVAHYDKARSQGLRVVGYLEYDPLNADLNVVFCQYIELIPRRK